MLSERRIRALVRACQRADARSTDATESETEAAATAWTALYTHFHPRIVGFCRRTLPGADAEELAAEILLKVRFRLAAFDAARPLAPWLFRVAANRCWDEARRRGRSQTLDEDAGAGLESQDPDPLERLLANESRDRVRAALARLPRRQRFALSLRYAADFSYQQIADTLGVTRTNAGVLLFRGRRRLRRLLITSEV